MINHRHIEESFCWTVQIDTHNSNSEHECAFGGCWYLGGSGIEHVGCGGCPEDVGHVECWNGSAHEEDQEDRKHHEGKGPSWDGFIVLIIFEAQELGGGEEIYPSNQLFHMI